MAADDGASNGASSGASKDDGDVARIAAAMREGVAPRDGDFDRFIPADLRAISWRFWTPLAVAVRAAAWFDELGIESVVDVGSGVGKLCVAAALAGRNDARRYHGVEHRQALVTAADALARTFGVADRVSFSVGVFPTTTVARADAYYLYNPFGENIAPDSEHLAEDVELSDARFEREVAAMEGFFGDAPVGTCVLIYNGFGGRMPATYHAIRGDFDLPNVLRLWQKTARPRF